jgi:type IV secretion system protein VirB8
MTDPDMTDSKEDYYARAASWAEDRQTALRASRRTAWIIAGVAVGIAALEALALVALAPLKSVVPYTLLVDRNTGYVQMLKGTGTDTVSADEALTQSLLAQYVIAREGFDIASIQGQYRKVALWSADAARRDYLATIPEANPVSPLRRLPRTSIVTVTVKSVSPIGPSAALVRFETQRIDQGQSGGERAAFVAVIRYRFSGAPMAIEDRLVNPLGFQVTRYRRDQEAVTPPEQPVLRPTPMSSPVVIRVAPTPEPRR